MPPNFPPPQVPTAEQRRRDPEMALLQPDEALITVVHRHPIGIIFIYLEALAFILAIIAVTIFTSPSFLKNLSGPSYRLLIGIIFFAVALLVFVLLIATYVYRENKLLVTDRSLIQVFQRSLFSRKVSRLSMSNVEDVNADQRGILATIFNYGTLTVQTAGEMENFIFIYCPDPNKYADRILDARQAYAQSLQEEIGH